MQALVQDPLGSQADGALLRSVLATKVDAATFRGVCAQSFFVVAVAELFDKTWFVTLLCSLSHGPRVAFVASFLALALHTVLAACLGAVISKFFALWLLHSVTASVFFLFAGFYAYECYKADPEEDALRTRTEDAKEALGAPDASQKDFGLTSGRFFPVFLAVFIAEWGDRTQVSMITLHSSLPVVPVCLGSLVAFLVLSASAALVAQLLEGRRLSERLISGVSAASFLAFGLLAAAEAAQASRSQAA